MKGQWTDRRIEYIIGHFLRTGVIIASLLVLTGGILYLTKHAQEVPEYRIFSGEPADLRSVHGIVADAAALRSRGIIQLGLLLLMATPLAWVTFLLIAFKQERDSLYVAITGVVLAALLFSLLGRYLFG